jgi:phosphatidate cytidylyltransferase
LEQSRRRNLSLRIASAAVLAPGAVVLAYIGGWPFFTLCLLGAAGILWEWAHLIADTAEPRILVPGWLGFVAALILTGLGAPGLAVLAIVAGVIVAAAANSLRPDGTGAVPRQIFALWGAAGVAYAGAGFLGAALLRRDPDFGFTALVFLFAVVWATDIFAFVAGRAIGGPRLCPKISPNKTWAGAIGGLAGGLAAGLAVAYASGIGRLAVIGVIGLVLSVLTQAGDLLESAVKRHFGAKDAGRLIPGHGGVMDRLDGFIIAAFTALAIGILHHGIDAPGRGFLLW